MACLRSPFQEPIAHVFCLPGKLSHDMLVLFISVGLLLCMPQLLHGYGRYALVDSLQVLPL
jgi:hypothetical protein